MTSNNWFLWAALSASFAAFTSIFAKIGLGLLWLPAE